jgi:poly(beta-D-mannuronate) lyase
VTFRFSLFRFCLFLFLAAPLVAMAPGDATGSKEHSVSSSADIAQLGEAVRPGEVLVMTNGTWTDQTIVFRGRGTPEKPITLRAQTPGKVVLTGNSSITIDGEYLVVSGLSLKDGLSTNAGVAIKGSHCRLTDTAVVDGTYKFFVRMWGTENRLDHCYLAGKTSESPTLQVEVERKPNHHRIDHNHFGARPPLGRNGGETIRVGYSWQSMTNSGTTVEQNLFERCDGELEIVSNKSCENIYRGNTFLDCAGMFTLRHGNRCRVEGNFFFGHHKRGSGGIRVIGEDHVIINNYIDGVEEGAFRVTSGILDSPLVGYFRARNCLIAFNTVVDSAGPCIELAAGLGTSRRTLLPENITIANNVFSLPQRATLLKGKEGDGFKWLGNIVWAGTNNAAIPARNGVKVIDPKLVLGNDHLWRPTRESPLRGGAEGGFSEIKSDIDGQERKNAFDAGCDQFATTPVNNRPLMGRDVGPSWMNRTNSLTFNR